MPFSLPVKGVPFSPVVRGKFCHDLDGFSDRLLVHRIAKYCRHLKEHYTICVEIVFVANEVD